MKRTLIKNLEEKIGEEVLVKGWVRNRRDHGKLIFLDLVDFTGQIQAVSTPKEKSHNIVEELRNEWVIECRGVVNERPEKMREDEQKNGHIEVKVKEIKVLAESETPPFELTEDTINVQEKTRLKYRYLDLRTERMQKNMKVRNDFLKKVRSFLYKEEFKEIETPLLTKRTPEGARDFLVPSRMYPGKFYALPQSPQQYKQLLMAGGIERYFQIARAMRDEDLRGDRGFEHTQIDIEMSFVERDDVLNLIETMITEVVEDMGYSIKEKPFPRITYKEAMKKYGDDKFDLRTEEEKKEGVLAYAWVLDFPFFEKTEEGSWTFSHNPFSMPKEDDIDKLLKGEDVGSILTTQYDLVCNGFESGGGSIRSHKPEILRAVYKIMGLNDGEIEESVGHMLEAFKYGTPPHGGIALGLERNIMNLTGEESLREVQAFPMTRRGKTAVMEAPDEVSPEELEEYGLKVDIKKDE